jgi:hypothetical protein
VRPQGQGRETIDVRSRVRYRITGIASFVSVGITSSRPLGDGLQRVGVDHLEEEVVLGEVEPALLRALAGDARPHHLREAVVVEGRDLELLLDLLPHRLRPRLGPEEPVLQGEGGRVQPHLDHRVGDVEGVARRRDERGRPVVAHDADLALRVGRRDGDHRGPEPLRPLVEPPGAGEEAVVEGDLDHVVLRHAAGDEHAGGQVAPGPHVVARVADRRRVTGRAGGGVDADDVAERHGEEPVRVVGPEVVLRREGEAREVGEGAEVVRVHPMLVEPLPVEGHVAIDPDQRRLQPLELELLQLGAIHALALGLPDHGVRPLRHGSRFSASRSAPR